MAVAPSALKRSLLSALQRVPRDEVFHPGHDFAGSLSTLVEDRFRSLDAQKIPKYDEDVIKSFDKGLREITENRWKKQYPMAPSTLIPSSNPIINYRRLDSEDQIASGKMKPWWRNFFELEAEGFEDRVNSGSLDNRLGLPKRTPGMTTWQLREAAEKGQI